MQFNKLTNVVYSIKDKLGYKIRSMSLETYSIPIRKVLSSVLLYHGDKLAKV